MSYRELRSFTEMMRALGYPRLVSIENFRNPNFPLVAEILAWLIKRYDSEADVPLVLDSEQDRVIFVKTAALYLVQKARIKVNPKKLYQADGYAVQELLKVAGVLYGSEGGGAGGGRETEQNVASLTAGLNARMSELRVSRQLAGEIPERGAALYDLLSREAKLREDRSLALARELQPREVEKSLRNSIKAVEEDSRKTLANLNNIASDEASLDAKIQKKTADLERQQKRLAQLSTVRPAYMDEFEKLEAQLKSLYAAYVHKFRNLAFLSQLQSDYDKAESERKMEAELSLRKLAEKMRDEERSRLADAGRIDGGEAEDLGPASPTAPKAPRVYGNITGAGLSEEEEEEDGSLLSDDDEDDDDLVMGGGGEVGTGVAQANQPPLSDFSDGEEIERFGLGPGQQDLEHPNAQPPQPPLPNSDDDF